MKRKKTKKGRKRCIHMCTKIEEIRGLNPNDIAERVLKSFNNYDSVEQILEKMNIKCESVNFSPLDDCLNLKKDNSIKCVACCTDKEIKFYYSSQLDKEILDFVLAHELGHCCLHLPLQTEYHVTNLKNDILFLSGPKNLNMFFISLFNNLSNNKKNYEADKFAIDLLQEFNFKQLKQNNITSDLILGTAKDPINYTLDKYRVLFRNNYIREFLYKNEKKKKILFLNITFQLYLHFKKILKSQKIKWQNF